MRSAASRGAELKAAGRVFVVDELVPAEVRVLPDDLATLDELLSDPGRSAPMKAHWQRAAQEAGVSAVSHGRPTIAMRCRPSCG